MIGPSSICGFGLKTTNESPRELISSWFFGHTFQTTNAGRPIKGSKNADFHLVF